VLVNQAPSRRRRWNAEYLLHRPVRGVIRRINRLLGSRAAPTDEITAESLERTRALIRGHLARDEIIPEELRGIHLYDAYMEAQSRYRATPLPVPTLLFRATEQEKPFMGERWLGWERLVTVPIEVRRIRANHVAAMSRKSIERICSILRKRLEEAAGSEGAAVTGPQAPPVLTVPSQLAAG
jgi:thioesterase domain-containing protein